MEPYKDSAIIRWVITSRRNTQPPAANHPVFPLCKEAEIYESGSSFAKVLRSYQTGGITYSDFLGHVNRYLEAGESPAELLEVLRRRQLIEPLPDFAHDALARLLNEPSLASIEEPGETAEASLTCEPEPMPEPTPAAELAPELAYEAEPTPAAEPAPTPTPTPVSTPTVVAATPVTPTPTVLIEAETEPELEKTVAITRATPSLEPIPAHATFAHIPAPIFVHLPEPSVAAERTVAISGGTEMLGQYDPPVADGFEGPLPANDAPDARASTPARPPWKLRAVWLSAALAIVTGWLYVHPLTSPHRSSAAKGVTGTAAPQPAAAEPGAIIQDCPTCPRMTVLPAGRFKQGSTHDDHDALPAERPQHIVLIRQMLAMATTELTVEDFREFATATKRELPGCETYDGEWHHQPDANWQEPGFSQSGDHPVTCVSWNDAVAYAGWLSARTGHRYRLPSASEWEYAARAGSDAQQPWSPGLQAACDNANVADRSAARRYPKWNVFACKDGYTNTAPVGSFKANAFGINDMLGNVFEWTQDCWHDDYSKAPVDGSARMDGDCNEHELRGGSWFSSPAFVRLAYRNHFDTGYRSSSIGIRLVRELAP